MRVILNRLILLLFFFAIIGGVKILGLLILAKPFIASDFLESLATGVIFWIIFLALGKGMLKDWPFKTSQ